MLPDSHLNIAVPLFLDCFAAPCNFQKLMTSPWLLVIATGLLSIGGLLIMVGEMSGPFKWVFRTIGGGTVAAGATSVVTMIFPSLAATLIRAAC